MLGRHCEMVPQYELLASLFLGALAIVSLVSLAISAFAHRGVKLSGLVQDATSGESFDMAKTEDIVDGEPVNATLFWSRVSVAPRWNDGR